MAQILTIHSFRGGTGKSSLVANVAGVLAAAERRVAVVDADLQSPGIHILFGLPGAEIALARHFSALHRWLDLTLPVVSLLASGKATEAAQTVFGNLQIEDLWQPFFCVASDLTHAGPLVFTTGPLWQAVRASTSIPAIFAPVLYENRVLVDGAVLNNLPIDIMRDHIEGGMIVAVNVFPDVDLEHHYSFDTSVSGFETLLSWVNPFAESMPVPNIFESLVHVMALNDVQQARAKRDLAGIYIRPPVERYRMLDFGAYPQIIDIGYQAACAEIARAGADRRPAPARMGRSHHLSSHCGS